MKKTTITATHVTSLVCAAIVNLFANEVLLTLPSVQCRVASSYQACKQVRKSFTDATEMFTSKRFRCLLRSWARVCKISNMGLERLLASFKQGAPTSSKGQHPDVERFCAAGFMTQLLSDHRKRGRFDPKVTTREQLLHSGVAIAASRPSEPPQRRASNFAVFQAECLSAADRQKNDWPELQHEMKRRWRDMSPAVKEAFTAKAKDEFREAQQGARVTRELADTHACSQIGYQTFFESASDRDQPFTPAALEAVVRRESEACRQHSSLPGFRQYADQFRDRFVKQMLIEDDGSNCLNLKPCRPH